MGVQTQADEAYQDPVLINDWHVVARSRDLPEGKILKVRVLGEDLIVWRHKGEVMAWEGSLHSPRLAALDGMD